MPTGFVQETLTADLPKLLKTAGKVHALVLFPVKAETLLAPGRPSMFTKTQPEGTDVVDATVLKSSLNAVWAMDASWMAPQKAMEKSSFLNIVDFFTSLIHKTHFGSISVVLAWFLEKPDILSHLNVFLQTSIIDYLEPYCLFLFIFSRL